MPRIKIQIGLLILKLEMSLLLILKFFFRKMMGML